MPQYPTIGDKVVRFIEGSLLHGDGEWLGKPFLLEQWEKDLLHVLYAYDPDTNRRVIEEALIETPKGEGKTPLCAAIAAVELLGPSVPPDGVRRSSPLVRVAAGGYDQANNLFGTLRLMMRGEDGRAPLAAFVEDGEQRIALRDYAGAVWRVAAAGGTLDGGLPTCVLRDETHEWTLPKQEQTHEVLGNDAVKRNMQGGHALTVDLSTPGSRMDSVLGRLHTVGVAKERGELEAPEFLFVWHRCDDDVDLDQPDELRHGLAQAYRSSFINTEVLARKWERPTTDEHYDEPTFRRKFLAQWVKSLTGWLPLPLWNALTGKRVVPPKTRIGVGFDGSINRDATVMRATAMIDGRPYQWTPTFADGRRMFWEKPADAPDTWRVPKAEVDAAVHHLFDVYDVGRMLADPYRWKDELAAWQQTYEDRPLEYNTASAVKMGPAVERFEGHVKAGDLVHDGDAAVLRHLENVTTEYSKYGKTIHKESPDSPRRIDAAVASVLSLEALVTAPAPQGFHVWTA